jgi:hypothetical protein
MIYILGKECFIVGKVVLERQYSEGIGYRMKTGQIQCIKPWTYKSYYIALLGETFSEGQIWK